MKILPGIVYTILLGLLLNSCNEVAKIQSVEGRKSIQRTTVTQTSPVVKTGTSTLDKYKKRVEELGGSRVEGATVSNADGSLTCSLKNWSLIGVFRHKTLIITEGELVFKITNRGQNSQKFVLPELLILDKEGKVLTPYNPFRKLQGIDLELNPPLESGQTREVKRPLKFRIGWHTVKLKTCRWLKTDSQYFDIYPELKNYSIP